MNELDEKTIALKKKILNTLQGRVDGASLKDLRKIAEIIKVIEDDSNLYLKMLAEISGEGYGFGKKKETPTADTTETSE